VTADAQPIWSELMEVPAQRIGSKSWQRLKNQRGQIRLVGVVVSVVPEPAPEEVLAEAQNVLLLPVAGD
jgi:hypothetical protein